MASFTKVILTGSTNGRNIKVAATSSPGTTIHTAIAGTAAFDEVWLWANNTDTVARDVTIEFGGTTSPDDEIITASLPAKTGMILIMAGFLLQNTLVVKAWSSAANVVTINGYINRIQ